MERAIASETVKSDLTSPDRAGDAAAIGIGIDVGGTKILGGIVSSTAEILFHSELPTRRGHLLSDVLAVTQSVIDEARRRGLPVTGLGVGMTGFIDRANGTLIRSMNMDLSDLPLGKEIAARTSLPVQVDNDVHAATFGEIHFGAGQKYRDFLLYNAGTGLATGMVFDGRLYRGASSAAGENGHISVDQSGTTICSCGMSGDVEMLLLAARAGKTTPPAYLPRIEAPPRLEYGYLALNLVQLVNLLNPAAIVLAGGMFSNNPEATEWVLRAVRAHALPMNLAGLDHLALSRNAPFTGLVGAAALVLKGRSDPTSKGA